jgi:hypothetical protein
VPGSSFFQATFSVPLQRVGTPCSSLDPSPRGPRQHGQFSAKSGDVNSAPPRSVANSRDRFIVFARPKVAKSQAGRRGVGHRILKNRPAKTTGRGELTLAAAWKMSNLSSIATVESLRE